MGLFSKKKKPADSAGKDKQNKKQVDKPEKLEIDKEKKEHGKHGHGQAYKHLIRPAMTEKASYLGMYNQYVFEVAPESNKSEIKKAIKALYGVEPVKINIMNMRGKTIRYGRNFGQLKNWKKAIITLRSGDKLDVYEGV